MQVVALLGVERGFRQQRGHAHHAVERRADLVAHGGQEGRLRACGGQRLLARGLEFGGALGHPGFEGFVGQPELLRVVCDLLPVAVDLRCAVVQHVRELVHLADAGGAVHFRHRTRADGAGRVPELLEPARDAPRQPPGHRRAEHREQPDGRQRGLQRLLHPGGEVGLRCGHHQPPAQAQRLAEGPLHQRHGPGGGGDALEAGVHRDAVLAALGVQRLQGGKRFADHRVGAVGGAAQRAAAVGAVQQRVAGGAGEQMALLVHDEGGATRAHALGAQALGQAGQPKVGGKHAGYASVVVIDRLRQGHAQLLAVDLHRREHAPLRLHRAAVPGAGAGLEVAGFHLGHRAAVAGCGDGIDMAAGAVGLAHGHAGAAVLGQHGDVAPAVGAEVQRGHVGRLAREGEGHGLEVARVVQPGAGAAGFLGGGPLAEQGVERVRGLPQQVLGAELHPVGDAVEHGAGQFGDGLGACTRHEPGGHTRGHQRGEHEAGGEQPAQGKAAHDGPPVQ